MSLTITLHAWWLLAYLGIGCVVWLPLSFLAYRQIHNPYMTFWAWLGRLKWWHVVVQAALWPVVAWDVFR